MNATYYTLWWPQFDQPVYVDRIPVWSGTDYVDPDTGEVLPTWEQALDALDADPDARPAHVLRFGSQLDMQGVIPKQAERAVRYLTKYLTKAIGETFTDPDTVDLAYEAHVDRLHAELRVPALLPALCELAALRRPTRPPRTRSGPWPLRRESSRSGKPRHSQQWFGKTIAEHKADRAAVVREAPLSAGVEAPELDRMAAAVTLPDGSPRFVWTDTRPDHDTYVEVILHSVAERRRWRAQYEQAKTVAAAGAVHSVSTVDQPP